jgi:hypothetical protein
VTLAQRQKEVAELALAAALGRPERRCPSCDEIGAHWIADGLDEHGIVVPGRFTCSAPTAPAEQLALDFGGEAA